MCAGSCVAEFQCDTDMWWDNLARRHSDTNSYLECERTCNAPPSAIGAGDEGVCYVAPTPCEACNNLCDEQMDWMTADERDWVEYSACSRICSASADCAGVVWNPTNGTHPCDVCKLPCDTAMDWTSVVDRDWAEYDACARSCDTSASW